MTPTRVVVLGGGIAGLTAARELKNAGVETLLFKAGPKVAGLASTERDPDGFSFDLGAHFITNRLAAAVGIGDRCRVVRRYGEMVRLGGRSHRYPTGLLANPRFLMSAIASRTKPPAPSQNRPEAGSGTSTDGPWPTRSRFHSSKPGQASKVRTSPPM